MTKMLLNNNHIESLIKGTPVKVGGVTIMPTANIQKGLMNVKRNGWENDVDFFFSQDKKMEIRMKSMN